MGHSRFWVALATLALAFGLAPRVHAQACSEELRTLRELHQSMRGEVMLGHARAATELAAHHVLDKPVGYAYDGNSACQHWYREVGNDHRFSCSLDLAAAQFEKMRQNQSIALGNMGASTEIEQTARQNRIQFTCESRKELYLICTPSSSATPDAWCARPVTSVDTLVVPSDANCKIVDKTGYEIMPVANDSSLTCPDDLRNYRESFKEQARAERRASVAAAGTVIALVSAVAVPATFVTQGLAKLLRKMHAIDPSDYERIHHRSFRARERVLPLLGITALSVSSISSRWWYLGILSAGSGITADVLLTQVWHGGSQAKRAAGIATAVIGAGSGLALNIETLLYSDVGSEHAFVPTLHVGLAQVELGVAGRF